jgi:hypothetical protein
VHKASHVVHMSVHVAWVMGQYMGDVHEASHALRMKHRMYCITASAVHVSAVQGVNTVKHRMYCTWQYMGDGSVHG